MAIVFEVVASFTSAPDAICFSYNCDTSGGADLGRQSGFAYIRTSQGAYSAPPDSLAGLRGRNGEKEGRRREQEWSNGKGGEGGEKVIEEGRGREGKEGERREKRKASFSF